MNRFGRIAGIMAFMGMLACSHAGLILNGDFESGNTGFSSQYEYTSVNGGLATGGEGSGGGRYGIGTNPQFFHPSFVSAGDHTTGSGNMMVVNGSFTPNKVVWSGTVAPPLTIGTTYKFSAWVMNVYPTSPANLQFSFGGNTLGTIAPTGSGVWQEFTAFLVATADQSSGLIDLNIAFSGNDFAVDDITLTAVPEPATMLAGALLLLPFGASTLRRMRKS